MNVRKTKHAAWSAQAAQMDWLHDLPEQGLSAENTLQWLHAVVCVLVGWCVVEDVSVHPLLFYH